MEATAMLVPPLALLIPPVNARWHGTLPIPYDARNAPIQGGSSAGHIWTEQAWPGRAPARPLRWGNCREMMSP